MKQRGGCLPYADDPQGFLTILAQTLTLEQANIWSAQPENIHLAANDSHIRSFAQHYLVKVSKIREIENRVEIRYEISSYKNPVTDFNCFLIYK